MLTWSFFGPRHSAAEKRSSSLAMNQLRPPRIARTSCTLLFDNGTLHSTVASPAVYRIRQNHATVKQLLRSLQPRLCYIGTKTISQLAAVNIRRCTTSTPVRQCDSRVIKVSLRPTKRPCRMLVFGDFETWPIRACGLNRDSVLPKVLPCSITLDPLCTSPPSSLPRDC
jgi:hypothetical protein